MKTSKKSTTYFQYYMNNDNCNNLIIEYIFFGTGSETWVKNVEESLFQIFPVSRENKGK